MSIFRDSIHQAEYDKYGYAKAAILSVPEVEQLLADISKFNTADRPAHLVSTGKSLTYHLTFLDSNKDYRRRVFQLIENYFIEKLRHIIPDYHILNASLVIKPPGSGRFEVHQDWSFAADLATKCMTVWCPLVDTSIENGTIHVLPRSNQLIEEFSAPNAPSYFDDFRESIIERWLQPIPTQAGHALLGDNHMIHWSGDNHTDIPRIAVQITCIPNQSQPVLIYYDEQWPEGFEVTDADREFWLTTDHHQLFTRQPHWKCLGYVPKNNQHMTEAEFSELLRTRTRQCHTE